MKQYQKFMFDNFIVESEDEVITQDIVVPKTEEEESPVEVEVTNESEANDSSTETKVVAEEEATKAPETEEVTTKTEPEVIVVSYSQDELDFAVKQAEERGYEKGFNTSTTDNETKQGELLKSIDAGIQSMVADEKKNSNAAEQDVLIMIKSIIAKIIPSLNEQNSASILEDFISKNFPNFRFEKSLTFTVNPQVVGKTQEIIAKLANKNDYEGKISIHKNENLGIADCSIEWRNGGVERKTDKMLEKIDVLLDDRTIDNQEPKNG